MTFSTVQIKNLDAKLSGRVVKTREVAGRELSYLEGWHIIAEANRIFGFDAWDRHTVSNKCIWEGMKRGCPSCAYVAKVRITVRAGPLKIVREGSGTGQGTAVSPAEAHDIALKAAETDATKRALSTFGNPFGLALYDKDQIGVRKVRQRRCSKSQENGDGARDPGAARPDLPAQKADDHPDTGRAIVPGDNHRARVNGEVLSDGSDDKASNGHTLKAHQASSPDKSTLTIAEPLRLRRPEHLRHVASKPCLICGRRPSEAHHLTFAQPRGLQMKSSDEYTVPLCRAHHRQLHAKGNEENWWSEREIDALGVASEFWEQTMGLRQGR